MYNYYKLNFDLMKHHGFTLTELNELLPWEIEVYTSMLIQYMNEKNNEKEKTQYE